MLDVALKFSTRQGLAENKYSVVFFRWKIETCILHLSEIIISVLQYARVLIVWPCRK